MQVVPGSVWGLVDEMLPATAQLQSLGARIEVANLREQAQLEQRARLASSSAAIAAFASGVHKLNRSSQQLLPLQHSICYLPRQSSRLYTYLKT